MPSILVVDYSAADRALVASLLEKQLGAKLVHAEDGAAALGLLDKEQAELGTDGITGPMGSGGPMGPGLDYQLLTNDFVRHDPTAWRPSRARAIFDV